MKKFILLLNLLFLASSARAEQAIANTQQFNSIVLGSKQPVIAKFSADYCPACKQAKPIFAQLSRDPDFDGVLFVTVDTQRNEGLSRKYNIQGIPSFLIFSNGVVVDKQEGLQGNLKQQLKKGLSKIKQAAPAAKPAASAKPSQPVAATPLDKNKQEKIIKPCPFKK